MNKLLLIINIFIDGEVSGVLKNRQNKASNLPQGRRDREKRKCFSEKAES